MDTKKHLKDCRNRLNRSFTTICLLQDYPEKHISFLFTEGVMNLTTDYEGFLQQVDDLPEGFEQTSYTMDCLGAIEIKFNFGDFYVITCCNEPQKVIDEFLMVDCEIIENKVKVESSKTIVCSRK